MLELVIMGMIVIAVPVVMFCVIFIISLVIEKILKKWTK